jgi:hypothetical protein
MHENFEKHSRGYDIILKSTKNKSLKDKEIQINKELPEN